MNERIKELAEKCFWDQQAQQDVEDFVDLEKFAELIVKECVVEILNTNLENVDGGDATVLAAASYQVMKHFGVK